MKNILLLIVFSVLAYLPSQAQFSISAQLRPRAEMNNGAGSPFNDSLSTFYYLSQRSRINFDFNNTKFQTRFSIQDVRIWGNGDIYTPTGVFASTNSLDVYEAWFKIRFGKKSDLTIGRQELKYDDQRLISWRNWNQYGLTYDAVVFNYKDERWEINTGLSYNNMIDLQSGKPLYDGGLFDSKNLMKSLNFLRIKRTFNEKFAVALIATGAAYQKTNKADILYLMGTYGLWAQYKSGGFEATANAYYQNGKGQSGKEISAYMLTIDPSYRLGKVKLGLGADYISGDDATSSDYGKKIKTFNKMYGAVFAYYGWMNYYSFMQGSTKNGGLVDIYPNLELSINKKHKVRGYFHLFSLAQQIKLDGNVIDNKDLGQELDLMYIYKHSPELMLQAGFSYYFTSDTLEKVKGVDGANTKSPYWAWVMLTFKPTLFTSK